MSKIRIYGDTSGYIDVAAPAAADNSTLDLSTVGNVKSNTDVTFTGTTVTDNGVWITRDNTGTEPYIGLGITNTNTSAGLYLDCNDGVDGKKFEIQSNPDGQLIGYCRDTDKYLYRITEQGAMTKENQPGFHASNDSAIGGTYSISLTSGGVTIPFNVVNYNTGNHYNSSTYTFTAPITGKYFCYGQARFDSITAYSRLFISVNGNNGWWSPSLHNISPNGSYSYWSHSVVGVIPLTAGDTIRLIGTEQNSSGSSQGEGSFGAYLIG